MWVALGNMSVLPLAFQSEGIIFVVFIVFEVIGLILSFAFASRVKKIRKKALEEYRAKQRKNNE